MIRLHDYIRKTKVNGPGERFTVWLQGCSHNCDGCFNPETHSINDGKEISVEKLAETIMSTNGITGLSVSGGEPFDQPEKLHELLTIIKTKSDLNVLIFTGYGMDDITSDPLKKRILENSDVIISGKFLKNDKCTGILSSSNQKLYLITDAYSYKDFPEFPEVELHFGESGEITVTGTAISGKDQIFY